MSVNTLVNLSLPTLEKRFKFSSKETGFIVSSNDITALILVVFVSFFGSYGHKTKWLGYGSILTGSAALLFALPKLLIGKYQPLEVSSGSSSLCLLNSTRSDLDCNTASSSFNVYYFIFVVSQLIAGAGTTPLFSLGPAYLDENVNPKVLSWYLAGFYTAVLLGPGLGSMIGGKLVSVYTDLNMPTGLDLTPKDPRWIGAWWLGSFCCGILLILNGFILLGFPAKLPGSEARRKKAIDNGVIKKDKIVSKGDFKSLLPNLKDIFTNWTYVFQNLGSTFTSMIGVGIGPFFFKLLTERYGATSFQAGVGIAIILLPGTLIGIGIGSFVVKKLGVRDSCRRVAKATFLLQLVGIWGAPLFLIPGCDYTQYAGVDVGYYNSSQAKFSLSDQCNAGCQCSPSKFRPLCGPDGVSYFSPCFAGCTNSTLGKGFTNCSCANPFINKTTMAKSDAVLVEQACHQNCPRRRLGAFIFGGFLIVALGFLTAIPSKTVTLRAVSENQRALGLGVQFVFLRVLASIPGPVMIGGFIDKTCTLWSTKCGFRENCLNYDYNKMGLVFCLLTAPTQALSVICYGLSWFFCKDDEPTTTDDADNEDAEINENIPLDVKNNDTTHNGSESEMFISSI